MEKKEVRCKGRIPGSNAICNELIYHSDGQFLFIVGFILNPSMNVQHIVCSNCGYTMVWKRDRKFVGEQNIPVGKFFYFERKK